MKIGNERFSYDEVELMAIYENVSQTSYENRVTSWWGDMDMYEFKFGVKNEEVTARLDEALKSVDMTREDFEKFKYTYRNELKEKMKSHLPQKYEVVVIFNKPMLFTCERMDRSEVPEGMFCYDIRHDDDCGGDMVEIKDKVRVNHWGTVLSRDAVEPRMVDGIEMKSQTGIVMNNDDYHYTGTEVSVEEYLKNYREFENEYCEPTRNDELTMGGM